MKRIFFQAAVVWIVLYGCTTWMLTKWMKKKLHGNYTRMLRAILNKSTKQQLYGQLPPITKTIKVRRTRHAGHCWRSKDELISDVLQWTPSHRLAKAGRPARTNILQLCDDSRCSAEDLTGAMDDRDGWRERVREMCTGGVTGWLWHMKCCNLKDTGGITKCVWLNIFEKRSLSLPLDKNLNILTKKYGLC